MQRARRLLRACNILNNTPTSIISRMSCIVIYIILILCLATNIGGLFLHESELVNTKANLSYFSIVVILLTIRSIYTGFFEDKRQGTKNNLRALTIHLPISKKDFILAQYIGNLYLFLPAFILISCLIVFNIVAGANIEYKFWLGVITLGFSITYCLVSLEKGILTCYYVDPRIREVGYLTLTFIWVGINYFMESVDSYFISQFIVSRQGQIGLKIVYGIANLKGLLLILVTLGVGYWCHTKLPIMLERRR